MKKKITRESIMRSIQSAHKLAQRHSDSNLSADERLRRIGRELKVTTISPGASFSSGFLVKEESGKYSIFYSSLESEPRCRFTIAHELAHIVLDQHFPHIESTRVKRRPGTRQYKLERVVDRIAAELLLPEELTTSVMRDNCIRSLKRYGSIQKRQVIRDACECLGASETALILRLLELPALMTVTLQIFMHDAPFHLRLTVAERHSRHDKLYLYKPAALVRREIEKAGFPPCTKQLRIGTRWGSRLVKCDGWPRVGYKSSRKHHEYWFVGWTWNTPDIPSHDDSISYESSCAGSPV